MQKQDQISEIFIDPVCLMKVGPKSPDIKSNYGAKTYHFCAEGCKKEFESNPGKFISAKQAKQKG